jgi:hypothetical protein
MAALLAEDGRGEPLTFLCIVAIGVVLVFRFMLIVGVLCVGV